MTTTLTYDEQLAIELAERTHFATIRAAGICDALNTFTTTPEWRVRSRAVAEGERDHFWNGTFVLDGPDGMHITISQTKGRGNARGGYDTLPTGGMWWPGREQLPDADIHFALDKTDQQVAKDIARRLLPQYQRNWAAFKKASVDQTAHHDAVAALAALIERRSGGVLRRDTHHSDKGEARFHIERTASGVSYGTIRTGQDYVRVELSGNAEFALSLATFLASLT